MHLYEQGLPESEYGLPSGEYASLGIHESQSRLWENHVGRSRAFWKLHYPTVSALNFPKHFAGITEETFYKAVNKVKPSLIRTESDELTYHFHVMIRYEIEKMLITGELKQRIFLPAGMNCINTGWMWMYPMTGEDVCRMYTGVMAVLVIFPPIAWEVFMPHSFSAAAKRADAQLTEKMEKGETSELIAMAKATNSCAGSYF